MNYADRATLIDCGYVGREGSWPVGIGARHRVLGVRLGVRDRPDPGGWLLDRFGAKRVYGASIALWSIFTMTQGTVSLLRHGRLGDHRLFVMRFMLGLVELPAFPGNARVVATWFPTAERGTASALFNSAQYLAVVALHR